MSMAKVQDLSTDYLICGAGPAGAALACFLSQHGLKGIMIAAAPGTADTPRAHITNMAALECLRDLGIEEECLKVSTHSQNMQHTRWGHSMTGEEYARIYSWGHDPHRAGDYDAASPCRHVDLPQTLLEPILVRFATEHGWDVKFNTTFLAFDTAQTASGRIVSEVEDNATQQTYKIESKYLFGCDGARSQVIRQLGIPLIKKPGGGVAMNVYVDTDLSRYVESRVGNLHWIIQPERDTPEWAAMSIARMVRPWNEWMFIIFPKNPDAELSHVTDEMWLDEVKKEIGDSAVPVRLINTAAWKVNEVVAERYSEGNIFCLGDAVHRHPPFNGLGSNTCIQDAYNLAWKVAYVEKKLAGPTLLDTFSPERQPVGHAVITQANKSFRAHLAVWQALGITESDVASRTAAFEELHAATPAGTQRRAAFQAAIKGTAEEFHALGVEMSQLYVSSAVYLDDEPSRGGPKPPPVGVNTTLHHQISTYPGSRLPHAWLNSRVPGPRYSTHDLAGHGAFTLFTGIGGTAWINAAQAVSASCSVPIRTVSIGWCQEHEDMYFEWAERREVGENGCILVRPDRFVCWRSFGLLGPAGAGEAGRGNDEEIKLRTVMDSILGRVKRD